VFGNADATDSKETIVIKKLNMIRFCTKTAFLFVFVGTKVKKHLVLFIFNELPQLCALIFVCLCSIYAKQRSLKVKDMRKLIIDKFQSKKKFSVPKSGRPRKTARITDRKIGMLSRQNPFWDAVKIKKEIPNVSLSVRSIRRRLNEIGFYGRKPAKKSFFSVKKRVRLQFAKEHLN
jgi:hypothetical protein